MTGNAAKANPEVMLLICNLEVFVSNLNMDTGCEHQKSCDLRYQIPKSTLSYECFSHCPSQIYSLLYSGVISKCVVG
jgi:hypothetical protein